MTSGLTSHTFYVVRPDGLGRPIIVAAGPGTWEEMRAKAIALVTKTMKPHTIVQAVETAELDHPPVKFTPIS